MEKSRAIIISEKRNQANNKNLDLDINDIINKSSPLVLNDKDTGFESEYNPKLDNICCDMCVYGLYPCRYNFNVEFFGLN